MRKIAPGDTAPDLSPYLHAMVPDLVSVVDGQTTNVATPLYILPLPECEDGADNDCDQRVDNLDPACVLPTAVACSRDVPCPDPATQVCNLALNTCISAGKELGVDDPPGAGCLYDKKDGGITDLASATGGAGGSNESAAGGAGGGLGGEGAGGQTDAVGGAGGEGGQPAGGEGGSSGI